MAKPVVSDDAGVQKRPGKAHIDDPDDGIAVIVGVYGDLSLLAVTTTGKKNVTRVYAYACVEDNLHKRIYLVRSNTVRIVDEDKTTKERHCTCEDFVFRQRDCKHIRALVKGGLLGELSWKKQKLSETASAS